MFKRQKKKPKNFFQIFQKKKKKKKKCFIVKNKYLTVARGCFVPMTFIRQEVAIKGNSMQKNSGKQILRSLLKNERNHFKNQWYIA